MRTIVYLSGLGTLHQGSVPYLISTTILPILQTPYQQYDYSLLENLTWSPDQDPVTVRGPPAGRKIRCEVRPNLNRRPSVNVFR